MHANGRKIQHGLLSALQSIVLLHWRSLAGTPPPAKSGILSVVHVRDGDGPWGQNRGDLRGSAPGVGAVAESDGSLIARAVQGDRDA